MFYWKDTENWGSGDQCSDNGPLWHVPHNLTDTVVDKPEDLLFLGQIVATKLQGVTSHKNVILRK
jgi:hypothetical protein